MTKPLPVPAASNTFERIKCVNSSGVECWSARELARVLEYLNFRNFQPVIDRAKEACAKSGHAVNDHFAEMRNMVGIGSGAQREVEDWVLSRYACYLVIQNADPGKPLVALGQTYFAVQTRRQELADDDALKEDQTRLLLRAEMKKHNKKGSTELAANLFRATQTEEKLRRDNIRNKDFANQIHNEVGHKVRITIEELGGTMPENLPVAENIKKVESREKKRLKAGQKKSLGIMPKTET